MSKNEVDTFALVINYLDKTCTSMHATMGCLKCMKLLVVHGFAIWSCTKKNWFDSLCDYCCEKWRQQNWNYGCKITIYY